MGYDATDAEIGWYLTGDRMMFLPPTEWFGNAEPMPGAVTEEELHTLGARAIEPVLDAIPVAGD